MMDSNAIDLSVNELNQVSDSKRYDLIYKSVIAGTAFRLDSSATKLDQGLWDAWYSGFTATMHKDEFSFIQKFAVLWSINDDDSDVTLGVPENIEQIVHLMKSGRIDRPDVDFTGPRSYAGHPTADNWTLIKALSNAEWLLEDIPAPDEQAKTPEVLRKIVDKIVNKISGGYYHRSADTNIAGSEAEAYFAAAVKIRSAFRKFRHLSTRLLPSDMVSSFLDGFYPSFDILIKALKRRYGLGNEEVSMVEHFKEFDKIIAESAPMEFKIGKLRAEIRKMLFIKEDEFPVCQDFPGHKEIQSSKEEFTPIVHTLLLYNIFKSKLPKTDWERVQKEYLNMLPGTPTDQKWHEHRYNLYKILDKEFKIRGSSRVNSSIQNICGQSTQSTSQSEYDAEDYDDLSDDEINLLRNYRQSRGPNNRQIRRPQNRQNRMQRQSRQVPLQKLKSRLNALECRNCSKWAGAPRHHHGPYGGGPSSNCPFDRNGNRRKGFGFIQEIGNKKVASLEEVESNDYDIVYEDLNEDDDQEQVNRVNDSYPF